MTPEKTLSNILRIDDQREQAKILGYPISALWQNAENHSINCRGVLPKVE